MSLPIPHDDENPTAAEEAPLPADWAHFLAIPWCAAHLRGSSSSSSSSSSNNKPWTPPWARSPAVFTTHRFSSETLRAEAVVPAAAYWLCCEPEAATSPGGDDDESTAAAADDTSENASSSSPAEPPATTTTTTTPTVPELRGLYAVGPGAAGYPGYLHGGMTATLFDDTLGLLAFANLERRGYGGMFMTASLETRFHGPVKVPGAVLVVASLAEETGSRMWTRGKMLNATGAVVASAECLFVKTKYTKPSL